MQKKSHLFCMLRNCWPALKKYNLSLESKLKASLMDKYKNQYLRLFISELTLLQKEICLAIIPQNAKLHTS